MFVSPAGNGESAAAGCMAARAQARARPEGLERSGRAKWKHGLYSSEAKAARQDARQSIRLLRRLLTLGF